MGRVESAGSESFYSLGGTPSTQFTAVRLSHAAQTAVLLAQRRGLSVEAAAPLTEMDFGAWSGCPISELEPDRDWKL